ncbi:hypothetical protein UM538_15270 (plasmid) [Staphylococcus aureus]|nr:hypothetical protein UM538_15270 [Staphylococcus aureus]
MQYIILEQRRFTIEKKNKKLSENIDKLEKRNKSWRTCGARLKMNCLEDTNLTVLSLANYRLRAERTRK